MNEPHWDRLINGHLDDVLTADERREFDALILESASARRRFWHLAEIHGLGREAAQLSFPSTVTQERPVAANRTPVRRAWFRWGPLPAAAAGLFIGLFTATTVLANVMPSFNRSWSLLQYGFEDGTAPAHTGVPLEPGRWNGDFTAVTGAEQGVTPATGTKMLRFVRADYEGKANSQGSYTGDLYRLIDLHAYRSEFADGGSVAQVTADFNSLPFPDTERYGASIEVYALSSAALASLADLNEALNTRNGSLAMSQKHVRCLDRDPRTWERMGVELRLPSEAEFLLIRLSVIHGKLNQRRETFDGQFLDDVQITLVRRDQVR